MHLQENLNYSTVAHFGPASSSKYYHAAICSHLFFIFLSDCTLIKAILNMTKFVCAFPKPEFLICSIIA